MPHRSLHMGDVSGLFNRQVFSCRFNFLRYWKACFIVYFIIYFFFLNLNVFCMLVREITVMVWGTKTSQGQSRTVVNIKIWTTVLQIIFIKKEEAKTSNTKSAAVCNLYCWVCYQSDFGFPFNTRRLPVIPSINMWSEDAAEKSESSCFSYWWCSFFFFFFFYPSPFFRVSALISLRTWFNTRECISLWGQIWNIWVWIIDVFLCVLNNGFS